MSAAITVEGRRGTVPGWSLRLGLAAVAGTLVAVPLADGTPAGPVAVLGVVALAAALLPASPAAVILGVGVAVLLAWYGDGGIRPVVLAAITLVHLLHVLSGVVAVIPPGSRVHPRALRRPALRFAGVQAVTLALAVLAWQLPRVPTPAPLEIAALLGLVVTAGFLVAVLRLTR